MAELMGRMQQGIKNSSSDFVLLAMRALTGTFIGVTMGLIVQEALSEGQEITLAFVFAFVTTLGVIWRLTRGWGLAAVLLFDLIVVLVGVLLRLYIMVAPN